MGISAAVDPLHLSIVDRDAWQLLPGEYKFWVGGSSSNLPLTDVVKIE